MQNKKRNQFFLFCTHLWFFFLNKMTLSYLNNSHFEIAELNGKKYLTFKNEIPNDLKNKFVLVYFYSPNCVHCRDFTPFFQKLPQEIKGNIVFAICNAQSTGMMNILQATAATTTPITEVPYVLLFHNAMPIKRFPAQTDIQALKRFITEAQTEIVNRKTIEPAALASNTKNPNKVCYLDYSCAYKNNCMKRTED